MPGISIGLRKIKDEHNANNTTQLILYR